MFDNDLKSVKDGTEWTSLYVRMLAFRESTSPISSSKSSGFIGIHPFTIENKDFSFIFQLKKQNFIKNLSVSINLAMNEKETCLIKFGSYDIEAIQN